MELSEIRQQIDQIDNEIIRLFLQRMHCSEEVARYKIQNGKPCLTRPGKKPFCKSGQFSRPGFCRGRPAAI